MAIPASSRAPQPIPSKTNVSTTDSGYKIAVRFGDQVLQAGFTSIPNLVLNHYAELGITPAEMMFTIHMWQFRWTERDPYPSLTTIADKMDVSWRQAHRYAKSLQEKRFLNIKSRQEPGRGQVTSEYDFEPLIQAVLRLDKGSDSASDLGEPAHQLTSQSTPLTKMTGGGMTDLSEAPLTRMSDEEYSQQEDPSQEDFNLSNIRKAESKKNQEIQNTSNSYMTPPQIPSSTQGIKVRSTPNENNTNRGEGFSSMGSALARSTLNVPPKRSDYGEERQVIMDYITRFAKEFNDHASLKTSTTRAFNLFKRSGLPLGGFIGRMYEAHAITKESAAAVPKPRPTTQSRPGTATKGRPAKNKMAYWFSVLEDRLGLRTVKAIRGAGGAGKEGNTVQKSS
jgi:hypothetical protein